MPDLSTIVLLVIALVMLPCFVCGLRKTIAVMHKSYGPVPAAGGPNGGERFGVLETLCPLCRGAASPMSERQGFHKCDVCSYQFEKRPC